MGTAKDIHQPGKPIATRHNWAAAQAFKPNEMLKADSAFPAHAH